MSYVKQILLGATGLCLTAAVIVIFFTCFNRLQETSNRIEQQAIQQEANVENYAILRYDNCTIYGSQLVMYLKNNWGSFTSVNLHRDGQTFEIPNTENLRNLDSDYYIDNNAMYRIAVEEDTNGVPNIIHITKQTE